MDYEIGCRCGKVIPVQEGLAGSSLECECGQTVFLPPVSILQATQLDDPAPAYVSGLPPVPDLPGPQVRTPSPPPVTEVLAPTRAFLQGEPGSPLCAKRLVMVALTKDAIWFQDTWRTRSVAIRGVQLEQQANGNRLALSQLPETAGPALTLTFDTAAESRRWLEKIQFWQSKLDPEASADDRLVPEGVALVRHAPVVPVERVGKVAFLHGSPATADRGVQLRAAMLGADAIIELDRKKCSEIGWGARRVTGLAVRVEDEDARKRLRWKWYAEEIASLTNSMFTVLLLQAVVYFFALAYMPGATNLIAATGETRSESIASAFVAIGVLDGWPLLVVVLLRVLRWRELLRPAGVAVLVVSTVRGLIVMAVHLLVVITSGASLENARLVMLLDPFDWAFIIAGAIVCVRAWQLADRAPQMLPDDARVVSMPRKAWSRGLVAMTGVLALVITGWAAVARYQESDYLLQEGVDPRREHEARLTLNQGAELANKREFERADELLHQSLALWEALTARRKAPSAYRANLALTLNNLGWIRSRQARDDEAEKYYSRAVEIADSLAGNREVDADTMKTLAGARTVLTYLRGEKLDTLLRDKVKEADRKYEEAEVTKQSEDPRAETLVREAIALWEEILPQATNDEYKKAAVAQISRAYIHLGELRERLGRRSDAEAALKKAINFGRRSIDLDPARPINKHNLDVAIRRLEVLQEQAFDEEINKAVRSLRGADAVDIMMRGIKEQDQRVRSGKDLELAVPSLAYRLNRLAWFLAHCPDRHLRDTKAAVEHARRATSLRPDMGIYWYTLATVQYRAGNWRDSLASLDTLKSKQGELEATDLLLTAMNLHSLDRKDEARSVIEKAIRWMDDRSQKAQADPALRIEFEMMRPEVETLMREAQRLIDGVPIHSQATG